MAQLYTGVIETLDQCRAAGKTIMVECPGCGHMRGFDPYKLRDAGNNIHLGALERRLCCTRCGRKGAKILIHMSRAEAIAHGWLRR